MGRISHGMYTYGYEGSQHLVVGGMSQVISHGEIFGLVMCDTGMGAVRQDQCTALAQGVWSRLFNRAHKRAFEHSRTSP